MSAPSADCPRSAVVFHVRAIDEILVVAVATAFAEGTTVIRGADDLSAKESDRLTTMAAMLQACGVAVEELLDGLRIEGGAKSTTETIGTHDDHRAVMAAAILEAAIGPVEIDDAEVVDVSFPGFAALWRNTQA